MAGWVVTGIASIHQGGTAMQPTLVIELVLRLSRLNVILHRGKSTHPTRSRICLSSTFVILKPSTSTPRHTTTASGWRGLGPGTDVSAFVHCYDYCVGGIKVYIDFLVS